MTTVENVCTSCVGDGFTGTMFSDGSLMLKGFGVTMKIEASGVKDLEYLLRWYHQIETKGKEK